MKAIIGKYKNRAVSLLFFNGIIAIIGFSNFAIIANETSNDFFAQWITFIAAASLLEIVRGGLLQAGFIRLLISSPNANKILSSSFLLSIILTLFIAFFTTILSIIPLSNSFDLTIKAISVFCVLSLPRSFLLWYFQGKRKYTNYFLLQVITFGGFFLYLLLSKSIEQNSIEIYCLLHLITGFPLFKILKKIPISYFKLESESIKSLLDFGRFSLGTQVLMNLLKNVPIFLIGHFSGAVGVSLYAIPLKLTELFDMVIRSLATHIYPEMIKYYKGMEIGGLKNQLIKYIVICSLLFILIAGVLLLFAHPLLKFLGANNSQEVWLIFVFFLLAKLLEPGIRLVGVAFEAINRPRENFYRYASMLFLSVLLTVGCLHFSLSVYYIAFVNVMAGFFGLVLGNWLFAKNGFTIYKHFDKQLMRFFKSSNQKLSNKWVFFFS